MKAERRKLTKAELRALGATPGLMARRISPDGQRARAEPMEHDREDYYEIWIN